jgi:hypothetical protein
VLGRGDGRGGLKLISGHGRFKQFSSGNLETSPMLHPIAAGSPSATGICS